MIFGEHDHFLGDGVILHQNEYNLFYHKFGAKYFHVKQLFLEKAVFSMKTVKTI